ncbi:hypothetical protein K469DRAFT_612318 [Zopfia rhizophila CBS 207.26]|uniref:Clr5 domain-containing protein n=1 Tax=Zopfia rhizophila CBS 207.26 TaxID=1314779 RepID=A0A6A6DAL8_9PEZI|nr:hypothetical protein K469DRAFT_612318 [Zopfia rhizophila CBS 207.26]
MEKSKHRLRGTSDSEWEQHKNAITDLFIVQNQDLKEVMETMKESHGYSARFEQLWGIRKNLTREDWQNVGRILKRRKREG